MPEPFTQLVELARRIRAVERAYPSVRRGTGSGPAYDTAGETWRRLCTERDAIMRTVATEN